MPVDPVSRARARLMVRRIYRDWTRLLPNCSGKDAKRATDARKAIRDGLTALSPVGANTFTISLMVLSYHCALFKP